MSLLSKKDLPFWKWLLYRNCTAFITITIIDLLSVENPIIYRLKNEQAAPGSLLEYIAPMIIALFHLWKWLAVILSGLVQSHCFFSNVMFFVNIFLARFIPFSEKHKICTPGITKVLYQFKKLTRKPRDDDEDDVCCICQMNAKLRDMSACKECGQYMHKFCADSWRKVQNTCPCCRKKLVLVIST
jgi:hypothetical protein